MGLLDGSDRSSARRDQLRDLLGRYGWDRDELYFLQASRHLSLGYVDFPMVTASSAG
jgi:hypothetical protein